MEVPTRVAVVVTSGWGYRYGLNAVINGLDYHGNMPCDIHIMNVGDIPDWYCPEANKAFDFDVYQYSLHDYMEKHPRRPANANIRWLVVHYGYYLARDLAPDYDVVMMTDADCLIGGKLNNYFSAVANTNLILLPNLAANTWFTHVNEATSAGERKRLDSNRNYLCTLANLFICNPKCNVDLYAEVIEQGFHCGGDMWSLFNALVDTNRIENIIALPQLFWSNPVFDQAAISLREIDGKRCYFALGEKMMVIHKRWWCPHEQYEWVTKHTIEGSERRKIAMANAELLLKECELINTTWKLPLEWDVSEWC